MSAAYGTTACRIQATDAAGDQASTTLDMTRANQVIAWNSVALQAVRVAKLQAPDAARALAIVQVSVYDAVNAIHPKYESYGNITVQAPRGASADAAAASAAETALVGLFPKQATTLQAELATALASIPRGRSRDAGVALGPRWRTRSWPSGTTTVRT